MTVRSVIIGLILAVLLGAVDYANDQVLRLNPLVSNLFPIAVVGALFLGMVASPLLRRVGRRVPLAGKELAVIMAMLLTASSIPRGGLMGSFTQSLVMPKLLERTNLSWQRTGVLDYVPPALTPGGHERTGPVVEDYIRRRAESDPVSIANVPWAQWARPLTAWVPLIFLMGAAALCLAQIVHPEWSHRERLRYPFAYFTRCMMGQELGEDGRSIWRRQAFWLGLAVVAFIHLVNGIQAWYPNFVRIPMVFNFLPLQEKFPWMKDVPFYDWVFVIRVNPAIVAFGVLVSADIGLSLGLSHILYVVVMGALLQQWGMDPAGDRMRGSAILWNRYGAYLAAAGLILYTGRHYYARVAAAALRLFRVPAKGLPVWAARGLLLSVAAMTFLLARLGMPWYMGLLVVLSLLLIYLVVARLSAEMGLFLIQPIWMPSAVLVGLFGAAALGPKAMVVSMLVSCIFAIDPQMSLTSYAVNALRIGQDNALAPGKLGWTQGMTYAVVVGVVLVVALTVNYNFGVMRTTTYTAEIVPSMPYNSSADEVQKLQLQSGHRLADSEGLTDWQRLTSMRPAPLFLASAGVGAALVLVFSYLRLRLPWWPLHPVIFLVAGSFAAAIVANGYLLGWLLRTVAFRLDGARAYRRLVVFVIGAAAGDVLAALVNMAVGGIYYFATGQEPVLIRIMG